MADRTAIDVWVNLFTEAGVSAYANSTVRETAKLFNRPSLFAPESAMTPDEFVALMETHGVSTAIIPAYKLGDPDGGLEVDVPYDAVQAVCDADPDRFKGAAGIDPRRGMDGVRELAVAIAEGGFIAGHVVPYGFDLPLHHRRYYPYYAKCAELDVPVILQTGHTAVQSPIGHGRPLWVDTIALEFPTLDIVAAHTGWPWTDELEAIAWKHPNVYIDTSAHAPKYWDETLVSFLSSRGRDKVLFGTDYPVVDYETAFTQLDALGLPDDVEEQLLHRNAERVFDI